MTTGRDQRRHLVPLIAAVGLVSAALTGCSGQLSRHDACTQVAQTLQQLDRSPRTVGNRTATVQDVAPDLQSDTRQLHKVAERTNGPLKDSIQRLSVDVARLRVNVLTHRDATQDNQEFVADTTQLQRLCGQ